MLNFRRKTEYRGVLLPIALATFVLAVACGGGSPSVAPTLQPLNPNVLKDMALDSTDVGDGYREVDSGYMIPTGSPGPAAPFGWAFQYGSSFEALDFPSSPVDRLSSTIELYSEASTIERNLRLSYFEKFDSFDVTVGDEAVGYGYTTSGLEGAADSLYVIRFRRGPVIATVHVEGARDLLPGPAEETVLRYAQLVSEKIDSVLKSPALSPPPP